MALGEYLVVHRVLIDPNPTADPQSRCTLCMHNVVCGSPLYSCSLLSIYLWPQDRSNTQMLQTVLINKEVVLQNILTWRREKICQSCQSKKDKVDMHLSSLFVPQCLICKKRQSGSGK